MNELQRNMYGCLPCPKCGSVYRYPTIVPPVIQCDDCGFQEPHNSKVDINAE